MKNASKILLLIGQIISIVCIPTCFLAAIACFVYPAIPELHEMLVEAFENNGVDFGGRGAEALVIFLESMVVTCGIMMFLLGVVCVFSAVTASKTIKEPNRNRLVSCIVFGVFSTNLLLVGGILGLIANNREARRKALEQE